VCVCVRERENVISLLSGGKKSAFALVFESAYVSVFCEIVCVCFESVVCVCVCVCVKNRVRL